MSTEFDGRLPGCTKSQWQLTDGLQAARKNDGSSRKVSQLHGKSTDGLPAAQNVDKSYLKVSHPHGKITKLMEGLPAAQNVDGS